MGTNTRVSGMISEREMVVACKFGQMDLFMKDTGKMGKRMDMVD